MIFVRPIDPSSSAEVDLVAQRMRLTLVEVLGEERGGSMYSMEWLRQRVLFHTCPPPRAQVFVAEDGQGRIRGHTIVRVEQDESGRELGLFSTTYVEPESRSQRIGSRLVLHGEGWMEEQGLREAATYTAVGNDRLIALFAKHGYRIVEELSDMVRLARPLGGKAGLEQNLEE